MWNSMKTNGTILFFLNNNRKACDTDPTVTSCAGLHWLQDRVWPARTYLQEVRGKDTVRKSTQADHERLAEAGHSLEGSWWPDPPLAAEAGCQLPRQAWPVWTVAVWGRESAAEGRWLACQPWRQPAASGRDTSTAQGGCWQGCLMLCKQNPCGVDSLPLVLYSFGVSVQPSLFSFPVETDSFSSILQF